MMARWIVVCGLLLMLVACREPEGQVALTLVYQNQFCSSKMVEFKQLPDQKSLKAAIGASLTFGKAIELPDVNFENSHLLLIAMGSRPNAGYHLELSAQQAALYDGKLLLPVVFKQPSPEMVQAAVMTSPCMIISLPKGAYRQIVVQSSDESLILKLDH